MKANLHHALTFALALFFLSPLLIILFYFRLQFEFSASDFLLALKNSLIQSMSAALLCILGSLMIVPGLSKVRVQGLNFAVLPSLLPSLFTVLIVFSYFKNFPFGHLGIILIFWITYFGMSTVILYQAYMSLVQQYDHLIKIYNISVWDRYWKIYWPGLQKDILMTFLLIVLFCFSSLSVPLLAGGGRAINVELLIYESIFIQGQWGTAALVAITQMGIIFFLGFYLNQNAMSSKSSFSSSANDLKKNNLSSILFMAYWMFYIGGYLFQVIRSSWVTKWNDFYWNDFFSALAHSFVLSVFSIILFCAIVVTLVYLSYQRRRYQFLMYFLLPSSTVVGLALFLIFPKVSGPLLDAVKISLGINIIYSLALYKNYIHPQFSPLQNQLDVSRIYGLDFLSTLRKIVFPQIKSGMQTCFLILILFTFCEFALIKAVGSQTLFAGVFIERLISTYRLEHGFVYSFIVLILVFCFYQLIRTNDVKDQSS